MGPQGGVWSRLCGAGASKPKPSEAGTVINKRSYEACYFSMVTVCLMPWWPWDSLMWT